jgi:hypothetical protein
VVYSVESPTSRELLTFVFLIMHLNSSVVIKLWSISGEWFSHDIAAACSLTSLVAR